MAGVRLEFEVGRGLRSSLSLNPSGPFEGLPRALVDQVGGRLREFLPFWEAITEDNFMLSVMQEGFYI